MKRGSKYYDGSSPGDDQKYNKKYVFFFFFSLVEKSKFHLAGTPTFRGLKRREIVDAAALGHFSVVILLNEEIQKDTA